jgi:hypothetical protein
MTDDEAAQIRRSADTLTAIVGRIGYDEAAAVTVGWSRRKLLTVALELARRNFHGTNADPLADPHRPRSRQRLLLEEDRWTVEDARLAHRMYDAGLKTAHVMEGNRVYARRARRARSEAAIEAQRQRLMGATG